MIQFRGQGQSKKALRACAQTQMSCACGTLILEANALGLTGLRVAELNQENQSNQASDRFDDIVGDKHYQDLSLQSGNSMTDRDDFEAACQHLAQVCEQLDEYFTGQRQIFELELAPYGTVFQHQVWGALANMAYGSHCSYADIANRINNPKAVRAVGAANGANPIAIES